MCTFSLHGYVVIANARVSQPGCQLGNDAAGVFDIHIIPCFACVLYIWEENQGMESIQSYLSLCTAPMYIHGYHYSLIALHCRCSTPSCKAETYHEVPNLGQHAGWD